MRSVALFILGVIIVFVLTIAFALWINEKQQTEPCSTYAGTDIGYVPLRCLKYFEK